jgi:Na+/H+-dicarboxylate symporter
MKLNAAHATHPLLLLLCAAAGAVLGMAPPVWSMPALGVVYVSTALLNLICMPLLVLATLSGLRHLMGLPNPAYRLGMIVVTSSALMLICAAAGILTAQLWQVGAQLSANDQLTLGRLIMSHAHADETFSMGDSQGVLETPRSWTVPSNVFFALTSGDLVAVMFCTLFFGIAFTVQRGPMSETTVNLLDAISRALEKSISLVNLAMPLLVLAYAAQIASHWNPTLVRAMSGYLLAFWFLCSIMAVLMLLLLVKLTKAPLRQILQSLKEASVISLVSASPLAAVPASIEGLSNRLGFSRGIVDMLMPTSAVFLRTGAAMQFAMLGIFVAHLYGHPLTFLEMLGLAPVAVLAALASAGSSGLASLGFAVSVVAYLRLPHEAALPLFAAVHIFSEGPARLLSLLSSYVMAVFVCGGLPKERTSVSLDVQFLGGPVRFNLSRPSAILMLSCLLLAGLLSLLLGVALGLRQLGIDASTATTVSSALTPALMAATGR